MGCTEGKPDADECVSTANKNPCVEAEYVVELVNSAGKIEKIRRIATGTGYKTKPVVVIQTSNGATSGDGFVAATGFSATINGASVWKVSVGDPAYLGLPHAGACL